MSLVRVAKAVPGVICPLALEADTGLFIETNSVSVNNLPTDTASAYNGSNWSVIANVSNKTDANMTGDISTYFECFGYDESTETWVSLTKTSVRVWDVTNYNYCLVHQIAPSAGAGVYFT